MSKKKKKPIGEVRASDLEFRILVVPAGAAQPPVVAVAQEDHLTLRVTPAGHLRHIQQEQALVVAAVISEDDEVEAIVEASPEHLAGPDVGGHGGARPLVRGGEVVGERRRRNRRPRAAEQWHACAGLRARHAWRGLSRPWLEFWGPHPIFSRMEVGCHDQMMD